MSRQIDKNDVEISRLFQWNKKVEITDELSKQTAVVYMRLVGDEDVGKARAYSFRRSAELRNKLKTPGTDEHEAFMGSEIDTDDTDTLINAIMYLRISELADTATKNISVKEPKEPNSDATLEEMEKYQEAVDAYPEKFKTAVQEEVARLIEVETEKLKEKSAEELSKLYRERIINRLCSEEINKAFYEMVIYLCTFDDEKHTKRAFNNLGQFLNSTSYLKKRLLEEYQSLELGMDFLKKSLEVTQ